MPFGNDCEYATFDACVRDQRTKGHNTEEAERICGALQRDTEEKCQRKQRKRKSFRAWLYGGE
jgi:2,3-bisphosphoglycerate-independent phosphoglycerate mutase